MRQKQKVFLLFVLLIPCWGIALRPGIDFNVYYKVSEWINSGRLFNLYRDSKEIGGFYYGPLSLVLFKPLAYFSFNASHWIFLFLQTVAYVVLWAFLFKLFPENQTSKSKSWMWLLVWAASIKPIHASFQCYNIQLFFAAGFILAEWLSEQENKLYQIGGGIIVSLLAAIKFFPGFLILLYWLTKNNRVRLGTVMGALLAVLLPVLTFGWETAFALHKDLAESLHLYHSTYPLSSQIFFLSLPSLLATWLEPFFSTPVIETVTRIINVTLSVLFYAVAWKHRENKQLAPYFFASGLALMTVINTSTRVDYYVFFLPAFCVLVQFWQQSEKKEILFKVATALCFSTMYLISEWTLQSRDLNHQLEAIRIPVVGMLLLLGLLYKSFQVQAIHD